MAAQFTDVQYDEDDAIVVRQRAEPEHDAAEPEQADEPEQVNNADEPEQVNNADEPEQVEQVNAAAEPEINVAMARRNILFESMFIVDGKNDEDDAAAEPSEEKLRCSHFQPRRRRFVGGSCVNCGAIGHKAKACFHRPMSRNMAQFTDVQYQADDHQFFLERGAAEDDIQYQTEDEDAADEVEAAEDQDHEQKAVAMGSKILFQDIFVVEKLDGKKSSDEYTPIQARSQNLDMFMHLDVKTEVYPMELGYKFTLAMAPEAANLDEFNWMGNIIVLEDIFVVDKRDGDGEKVLIVKARTGDLGMHMRLEVDTEAYPMAVGDKFSLAMALAPTA